MAERNEYKIHIVLKVSFVYCCYKRNFIYPSLIVPHRETVTYMDKTNSVNGEKNQDLVIFFKRENT